MRRRLKRLGLLLVSCILGLVLLEFAIRVALPQYDPSGAPAFENNANGVPLGVKNTARRMWKNTGDYDVTIRFNQYGLRDKKDLKDSKAGDLFVVGDSFSMGWGVEEEERFSDLLAPRLGLRVYNISMPGNFDDYDKLIQYARENGAAIERLIVGVCVENDLFDYETMTGAFGPHKSKYGRLQKVKNYLAEHSAAYVALTHLFHRSGPLKTLAVKLGLITPNLEGIDRHADSEKVLLSSASRLARLARPFKTTVLVIPSRLLWAMENREGETLAHERFVALLNERGLDVVDMRPYFEAGSDPLRFHFKGDGHWNKEGHAKAAEALASHLTGAPLASSGTRLSQ